MTRTRRLRVPLSDESGFTLIESLASLAMSSVIILVLASFLMNTAVIHRLLLRNTAEYDQVRVAFEAFLADARYAKQVSCDWYSFLRLYPTASIRYYIVYTIKPSDDGIQYNLHREVWMPNGSSSILGRDDIVGWNVVEPGYLQFDPEMQGVFRCGSGGPNSQRWAQLYLEKPPVSPATSNTVFQTMAYLRTR